MPSPTAATLHALHYHQVNVSDIQTNMLAQFANDETDDLADLLTIPLLQNKEGLSAQVIQTAFALNN